MRKYLTTGLFSAILGLAVGAPADAALVSRGFLDEALENYATTTALDLKADNADLTNLSNKIGELPEGITVQGMYEGWTDENGVLANPGLKGIYEGWIGHNGLHTLGLQELELDFFYIYNPENDSPQELREQKGGLLNVLPSLLGNSGYSAFGGKLAPFWKLTQSAYKTDELSAKIGTLPEGITVQGMYEGWTDSNKITYSGLNRISHDYTALLNDFNTPSLYSLFAKGGTITIPGYSTNTILPLPELSYGVSKIGTLPSGSLLNQTPFTDELYRFTQGTESPVYPNSMAELVKQIYGEFSSSGNQPGLVHLLITGFLHNGSLPVNSAEIGILPAISLAENANSVANTANETATAAKTAADANTAKIGTLPDGYETVGAALTAIKGIAEDAKAAALSAIPDPKTEGSTGKFVLTVDIVGDNATYRWEKIDREGETTTTE